MSLFLLAFGFVAGGFCVALVLLPPSVRIPYDPWEPGHFGCAIGDWDRVAGWQMPEGWGVAYTDWMRKRVIIAPIPFNLLARWARRVWEVSRGPGRQDQMTQKMRAAVYGEGRKHGRKEVEDAIVRRVMAAIRS